MVELLDSGAFRGLGYVVAAAVAVVWALRERARGPLEEPDWWPTYWWATAAVLLAMSLAVGSPLGEWLAEIGRARARGSASYEARRTLQAVAVGGIAVGWGLVVLLAVWRVPPRRRRYLPHAVGVSSLLAFAATRAVSLTQVDALLYRRQVGGLRIVSWVELTLLAGTIVVGVVTARLGSRSRSSVTVRTG